MLFLTEKHPSNRLNTGVLNRNFEKRLKFKSKTELQDARGISSPDLSERRAVDVKDIAVFAVRAVRQSGRREEIGAVKQIKGFGAKLKARVFVEKLKLLVQPDISLPESGTADGVARRVAERLARISGNDHGIAIQVVLRRSLRLRHQDGADDVGAVIVGATEILRDAGDEELRPR